jgi:hypothetical protein
MADQPALSTAQIARELGTHPATVARWIAKGAQLDDGSRLRLKAFPIPGAYRVRRADLDEFLAIIDSHRVKPEPPKAKPGRKTTHDAVIDAELAMAKF